MELNNTGSLYIITDYLPTVGDVLTGINFIIEQKKKGKFYHTSINSFLPSIAEHIIALYEKARIPTITKKHVRKLIDMKRNEYLKELKKYNIKKSRSLEMSATPSSPDLLQYHPKMLDDLFDIAHCKCFRKLINDEQISNITCNCSPKLRIPKSSVRFYVDQRTSRQLLISSLISSNESANESVITILSAVSISDTDTDTDNTISTQPHLKSTIINDTSQNISICSEDTISTETSSIYNDNVTADPEFEPSTHEQSILNKENRSKIDLFDIAIICDAKQVSSYAAASIISATLSACAQKKADSEGKLLHEKAHIVTPSVLQSTLNQVRKKVVAQNNKAVSGMYSFQFDGKICNALVTTTSPRATKTHTIKNEARKRNEMRKIDYITVVKQPGDVFIASIPVKSGSADNVFTCMKEYFEQNNISLNNVVAVGCDGAPVNTGVEHGVIRRFEEYLGRSLQWMICLLHLNELLFHRLFRLLDKSSCSPHAYSSELGNQLLICEQFRPVKFKRIKLDFNRLPANIEHWNLTNDQKYLLDLARAVDAGHLNDTLANQKPGVMNKARWITTMSRILRLYMTIKNPSKIIQILALYIIKIYIPVLLSIKENPSISSGSRHLHLIVSLSREYFNKPEYEAIYAEIKGTITNNSYFAHSENILLSMITDEDKIIRKLGYDAIILARLTHNVEETRSVRFFEKPIHIDFNANHYSGLINMDLANIFEPPLLHKYKLTVEDLQRLSNADDIINIEEIPSHTQATERYVQVTAQQVQRTSNIQHQQGAIHHTATFRQFMPKFRNTSDFKLPSSTKSSHQ